MVGGVVSTTVTLLAQLAVRPTPSRTEYLRDVVPDGKVPAGGLLMVTPAQASDADAGTGLNGALWLRVHSTVAGAGHRMLGGVVSTTVMLLVQLAVRPAPSVAV
jgi:hypothetical protein